jgi:hypothetical protein
MTLLDRAKELTPRNKDNGFDEDKLIGTLKSLILIDIDYEKERRAKEIINVACKPGSSEPDGQLFLPGLKEYDYEPSRLIRDDNGHIIENALARLSYKQAQLRRSKENLDKAAMRHAQNVEETKLFTEWLRAKDLAGLSTIDLTWGDFVKETGYHRHCPRDEAAE